ncbi:hypothetical protein Syun_029915 [Stephania yunnanensis]|uniref:Uncharacterized protein n=1 Tax=Stephania yunnanensis TaxID=152371 RepID=A0AAP0E6I5_9MAGN
MVATTSLATGCLLPAGGDGRGRERLSRWFGERDRERVDLGYRSRCRVRISRRVRDVPKAFCDCSSPRPLPSLPLNPSPSAVAAFESLAEPSAILFVVVVDSVPRRPIVDTQRSIREMAELYGSEKSFIVEAHRALSGLHSTALIALERFELTSNLKETNTSETPPTVNELYLHLHAVNQDGVTFIDTRSERFYAKLQMRRRELTQATPNQLVDDEVVYYNVTGKCPKGRVYGLRSLGRKKRKYADPGATTSKLPEMVPRSEFDRFVEQLRQVVAFMQKQFAMTMGGAGLSQPRLPPPPPPPHEQQHPPQIDLADPPQQLDNVDREMQDWLTRDEQLGDT